ncbi:MAG: hypothetical protein KQJ78_21970 [Deltaproteobacteria bacterium]|nr:hypothetical protein [Deltaproteobacteria bacterium]
MTTCKDKKHRCPDCRECQGCSETRCRVCRGQGQPQPFAGMSLAEQIALFEAVNRGQAPEGDYGG